MKGGTLLVLLAVLAAAAVAQQKQENITYDALYMFGSRSFSLWSDELKLLWDSADEIPARVANAAPQYYNSNGYTSDEIAALLNGSSLPPEVQQELLNGGFDSTSILFGPHPYALATGVIADSTLLFIGLRTISAILVYSIDGTLNPVFLSFTKAPVGDYGLVDLLFIPPQDTSATNGVGRLIAAFSLSSTAAFYDVTRTLDTATLTLTGRLSPVNASDLLFAPLVTGVPGLHAIHRHPPTGRLFFASGVEQKVHMTLGDHVIVDSIDTSAYGGFPSALASLDDVLAIAITPYNASLNASSSEQRASQRGTLVFVRIPSLEHVRTLLVGYDPVAVYFTADRRFLAVCNAGRAHYSVNGTDDIDPPGSISLVQLTNNGIFYPLVQVLVDADVEVISMRNIFLHADVALYDSKDTYTELEPVGLVFGEDKTSNRAYVLLTTQNAWLALDLETRGIEATGTFGTQYHGYPLSNPRDCSDRDGGILPNFWPISSLVQPTDMVSISVHGKQYYVTANGGDTRSTARFASRAQDVSLVRLSFKPYDVDFMQADLSLGRLYIANYAGRHLYTNPFDPTGESDNLGASAAANPPALDAPLAVAAAVLLGALMQIH